ncbi:UNVERIFIED_ORG: hypothetical protein M2425_002727 [Bradyrhizobium japonicum]
MTVACIAIFCEDIRREVNGRETLIGVLPTGIRVPELPWQLKRLSLYYRIRLPLDQDTNQKIYIDLDAAGVTDAGIEADDQGIPKEVLERAVARARERNAPYVEVIARLRLDGFPIVGEGRITALLFAGEEKVVGGYLNIALKVEDTSTVPSE